MDKDDLILEFDLCPKNWLYWAGKSYCVIREPVIFSNSFGQTNIYILQYLPALPQSTDISLHAQEAHITDY